MASHDVAKVHKQYSRFLLWQSRCLTELVLLGFASLIHLCMLPLNIVQVLNAMPLLPIFIGLDLLFFLLLGTLLYINYTCWPRTTYRVGLLKLATVYETGAMTISATDIPLVFRSQEVHEVALGFLAFLTAIRLAMVDIVLCRADVRSNLVYEPCITYSTGGFPYPAAGLCQLVCFAYAVLLCCHLRIGVFFIVIAYAAVYSIWISTSYINQMGIVGRSGPEPFDIVMITLITVGSFICTVYMLYFVLYKGWDQTIVFARATADAQHLKQHAVMERERLETALRIARVLGYERAITFAAHELRNPLHAINCILNLNEAVLEKEIESAPRVSQQSLINALRAVLFDIEVAKKRSGLMERVINNISDFSRLQAGLLSLILRDVLTTSVIEDMILSCGDVLGDQCEWGAYAFGLQLLEHGMLRVDSCRLQQLLGQCVSHAVSHGGRELNVIAMVLSVNEVIAATTTAAVGHDDEPVDHGATSIDIAIGAHEGRDAYTIDAQTSSVTATTSMGSQTGAPTTTVRLPPHLVVFAVQAREVVIDSTEESIFDPAHDIMAPICRRLDENTPLQDNIIAAAAAEHNTISNIRATVRSTNLATAVGKLLALRMGGDLLIFPIFPSSVPGQCEQAHSEHTWYAAVFPATLKQAKSDVGPPAESTQAPPKIRRSREATAATMATSPSTSAAVAASLVWHLGWGCDSAPDTETHELFGSRGVFPCAVVNRIQNCIREQAATLLASAPIRVADAVDSTSREESDAATSRYPASPAPSSQCSSPLQRTRHTPISFGSGALSASYGQSSKATVATAAPSGFPLRKLLNLHVLYADDDAVNRTLLARMVKILGCSIVCVEDGDMILRELQAAGMLTPEQLQRLQADSHRVAWRFDAPADQPPSDSVSPSASTEGCTTKPFDVILLDIVMNRTDGVDVCAALRTVLNTPYPIIAATGNAENKELLQFAGFSHVLEKPFSFQHLARALTESCPAAAQRTGNVR